MPNTLLDPKNDFVLKKLFVESPDLLADLINAARSDEDPVEVIEILNPRIDPEDLTGKFIIHDVLAKDSRGRLFNIEMQVRRLTEWIERSLYYIASAYVGQLKQGDNYATLKPVIGINLLDFELFEGLQAHWREDSIMSEIHHPPVQKAQDQLKRLSDDEEARWRALARERALHDEASFLASAHEEGREEGVQIGEWRGRAAVLTRQLALKFGELPAEVQQRIQQAGETELDAWAERVLFAESIAEIFR